MTEARKSRLDRSRSKQRRGTCRYKLPRLTAAMTCQEAFQAIARDCLDDLTANQQATREGDREALHQMRIALTRLRAIRSFFSSVVPSSEWSNLNGELKWLNKHLSRTRDLDVTLKWLFSVDDKSPEQSLDHDDPGSNRSRIMNVIDSNILERDAGGKPLRTFPHPALGRAWRTTWSTSHRELSLALQSRRYRILLRDMAARIEHGTRPPDIRKPSASLTAHSHRQLGRWYKKLVKKSRALEDMNASQRHRLRIKSKRFRYALETLGQLLPSRSRVKVRGLLKSLRKIQRYLGQLNDAEQGRAIATTLVKALRDDGTKFRSPFPTGRKARKRTIKATAVIFRQMAELKPF